MTDKIINNETKDGMGYIYIQDVPVIYAAVQAPKNKYTPDGVPAGSLGKEYKLTTFVEEDAKEQLEDLMLNKSLFKVGVDKNKKRQVKYKLTSQVKDAEEGWESPYDPYENLYGVSLTLPEKKKNGTPNVLNIVNASGEQISDLIGNGSVCSIKLFYYTNTDGLKNVQLDTIMVKELVPYEGGSSGGVDDVLGVAIQEKAAPVAQEVPERVNTPAQSSEPSKVDEFEDDVPF